MQRFDEWRMEFVACAGREPLDELNRQFSALGLSDIDLADLRGDILEHCYQASVFRHDTDPYEARRRIYSKAISPRELKSWNTAIERLRTKVRTAPDFAGKVFGRVILDLNIRVKVETEAARLLEQILEGLSSYSCGDIPFVTTGKMVQSYGCLDLGTRLIGKKNRRPEPETLLLFCLAQTFRICSAARARVRPRLGMAMPKDGEPSFDLTSKLINAVFGRRIFNSGRAAATRLCRFMGDHRDAVFIGWPK